MKCAQARKMFGAYWDDDTTQAEREWLESHFTGCTACRNEYEEYSRALEWVASLPRVEPAPDLVERTLARARRAVAAPDRIASPGIAWVPATAAAALLLVTATLISPWLGMGLKTRVASRVTEKPTISEPVSVPTADPAATPVLAGRDEAKSVGGGKGERSALAAAPDSLFDHGEDVEFILDPVTLRRGRAALTRAPAEAAHGERAVITF